jgi:hypothetical protein
MVTTRLEEKQPDGLSNCSMGLEQWRHLRQGYQCPLLPELRTRLSPVLEPQYPASARLLTVQLDAPLRQLPDLQHLRRFTHFHILAALIIWRSAQVVQPPQPESTAM